MRMAFASITKTLRNEGSTPSRFNYPKSGPEGTSPTKSA
jgi:hypothetical protein